MNTKCSLSTINCIFCENEQTNNNSHLSNNHKPLVKDKIENRYLTKYYDKENADPINFQFECNELEDDEESLTCFSFNNHESSNGKSIVKNKVSLECISEKKNSVESELLSIENMFLKNLQLNRESIQMLENENNNLQNVQSIINWDFYRNYLNCSVDEIRKKVIMHSEEQKRKILSLQSKYVEIERFFNDSLLRKMKLFKSIISFYEPLSNSEIVGQKMNYAIKKLKLFQKNRDLILYKFKTFQTIVKWVNSLPNSKFENFDNTTNSLQTAEIENINCLPVLGDAMTFDTLIHELSNRLYFIVNYPCKLNSGDLPNEYYDRRNFYTVLLNNHKIYTENLIDKFQYSKENYMNFYFLKMNECNQEMIRNRIRIKECKTVLENLVKRQIC